MDFKEQILDALEKLKQKEVVNKQPFKVKAYATVIKNLKASEKPISTLDDIKDIKGIGKSIHDKIKEILETGDLKQLEKYNEQIKIINELTAVHGIGPAKAKELVEQHHITGIEDLKSHLELLNEKQKMGLKYHEDFSKRIPRSEMEKHEIYLGEMIQKVNPNIIYQVVGSYRRGAKDSGDIDVIITHKDDPKEFEHIVPEIVKQLTTEKYLVDDFAVGPHKYLGVCKLKRHRSFRRIDILYATKNVWPFSLLYFTGSVEFNVALRNWALNLGYSMNEYGFKNIKGKDKDKMVKHDFDTEESVLNYLGLKYVEPVNRTAKLNLEDIKL